MVDVYVYQPIHTPRKVFSNKKVPLKALAVVSPVTHDAIVHNNQTTGKQITSVLLPYGEINAYKDVIGWVLDMVAAGKILRMRKIQGYSLLRYDRIQHIAAKLGIGFLKVGMDKRITSMLGKSMQPNFTMDVGELQEIYTKLGRDHPLRLKVSQALRFASVNGYMTPEFHNQFLKLTTQKAELYNDLQAGGFLNANSSYGYYPANSTYNTGSHGTVGYGAVGYTTGNYLNGNHMSNNINSGPNYPDGRHFDGNYIPNNHDGEVYTADDDATADLVPYENAGSKFYPLVVGGEDSKE